MDKLPYGPPVARLIADDFDRSIWEQNDMGNINSIGIKLSRWIHVIGQPYHFALIQYQYALLGFYRQSFC